MRQACKRLTSGCVASALVALLLLSTAGAEGQAWPSPDDVSVEARLARWLVEKGGELDGVGVGRECPTCLRGMVATQDLDTDHIIMKVPFSTMIRFSTSISHTPEYARELLERMHSDPSFNETHGLFWEVHPGPEDVFTPQLYTDEHLEMLQSPELAALSQQQRASAESVYLGTGTEPFQRPLSEVAPAVTLDTFNLVCALIHSRSFSIPVNDTGEPGALQSVLVPLVDLLNHSDEPNTWWFTEDDEQGQGRMVLKAVVPIQAGQEVTHSYSTAIRRPDWSLFYFGFVVPREEPLLAAADLPDYDAADPYAEAPQDDSAYDDPDSEVVSVEEYERLAARLDAAPTTEEDDQALLDGSAVTDWRVRAVLQYRVMRKRALRQAMERIAAHMGWGDADGEAQGVEWGPEEGGDEAGAEPGEGAGGSEQEGHAEL